MHNERRHVKLLEVLVEVGLGKCFDTFVKVLKTALHAPQPELVDHSLRDLRPRPIGAIEHDGEVLPELRTVLSETVSQFVEHFDGDSFGIGSGLHQNGRHSTDQYGRGNPLCAMTSNVARDL